MIRVAHLSDIHVSDRGRIADLQLVLDAFLERAAAEEVDLIVISGDFYERRSTPAERTFLADFLQRAAAISPVYGVRGNHDVPGDLEVLSRLETDHPLRIEERVTAEPESAWMTTGIKGQRIGCLGLAWIEKAHMAAGLGVEVDSEASRQMAIAGIRDLLTCLRAEATRLRQDGAAAVLVTHVMLGGSVVSNGQILIGQGIELSPSDLLDVGASYVACGHIHKWQAWFNGRVAYAGGPNRHDFGETEPKGFLLVTLTDQGEWVRTEFVELPAREIVLLEADWTHAEALAFPEHGDLTGAIVRFRYRVRAQDLHEVDVPFLEDYLRRQGAAEIKLEAIVEAETRVRSEEIVRAQTTAEKVDAFWKAKGVEVDEPTRECVFTTLADLEARA